MITPAIHFYFCLFVGTNDKAGGPHYLLKFVNTQSIKETHVPASEWKYSYMS